MPVPKDKQLYDSIATYIKANYEPSAYRSGLIVRTYKNEFSQKYGRPDAYYGNKDESKGLARWFAEDWTAENKQIGYIKPDDVYRPNVRINEQTPTTWSELTPQEIKAAKKEKVKTGRVRRFKK
jgi:hypothetical protein